MIQLAGAVRGKHPTGFIGDTPGKIEQIGSSGKTVCGGTMRTLDKGGEELSNPAAKAKKASHGLRL